MNMIELNDVWKKFRKGERFNSLRDTIPNFVRGLMSSSKNNSVLEDKEFWALKDVTFHVKKGDVLGVIGPNGAGKSTVLKLLSGIMNPNKGEMKINGRLSALIEVAAGFHPELTGKENIYLNGTIMGMTRKEIDNKFNEIVEFSGLSEFIDTPVKRYSSGMYSRLGFSVAAHMDPDILLVDEVLSVGDMAFQVKCGQKMKELFNSGVTIVLVSHNLSLIQSLCKNVILLHKGEILKEGDSDDVIPYYQNIVYKETEQKLKKKIALQDYKVNVKESSPVKILNVSICDKEDKQSEDFRIGDYFAIKMDYETKKTIENPIFSIDIIRADGVLCCSANTKDEDFILGEIKGKQSLTIDLGQINLAPGIYVAKISVWDKDMIHSYSVRKRDVFRIMSDKYKNGMNAVFLPKISWKSDSGEQPIYAD